jgi:hypothetical protein
MGIPTQGAGAFSAVAELTNKGATAVVDLTATNNPQTLPKGQYLAWLETANPSLTVFFKLASATDNFTLPTNGAGLQAGVCSFRGDLLERIKVDDDATTFNVKLRAGLTATLVLLKLV